MAVVFDLLPFFYSIGSNLISRIAVPLVALAVESHWVCRKNGSKKWKQSAKNGSKTGSNFLGTKIAPHFGAKSKLVEFLFLFHHPFAGVVGNFKQEQNVIIVATHHRAPAQTD